MNFRKVDNQQATVTFDQWAREQLRGKGLSQPQIDAVMIRVRAHPANDVMKSKWDEDMSSYPYKDTMEGIIWFTVRSITLEWIDETCPDAWFRPVFTTSKKEGE